ncbi:cysteinyl leukotriene receptor 2-like isoform X1 [Oryzias latipes]|uniref:cysteinyl leukotriene receptor 2-like isoform X1 n=1 Tax=Oryzias latipes TaxID=8090 RepID=UPI000CE2874F|nr:cysteinyl leukotriene receptor 2-like isoform X1 [Oryzias latipes]
MIFMLASDQRSSVRGAEGHGGHGGGAMLCRVCDAQTFVSVSAGLMSMALSTVIPTDRPTNQCLHNSDTFKYYVYTCTYMVVFPVAFLCNIGALVAFHRMKKKSTSSCRVVMMNLAISDWSFSLTLPLRLVYYFHNRSWIFPDWLCRLCTYSFYVNLYSSILFLTLLSLLRWVAVAKPFKQSFESKPRQVSLVCLAIWLFVGLASIPFLSEGVVKRDGVPRCFETSSHSSWCRISILNYIGLVFGFLLPFLTILFSYLRIVPILRSHRTEGFTMSTADPRSRRDGKRSVYLVAMVMVTFLICFLPYHLIRTLHLHSMCGNWSCGVKVPLQRAVSVTLCMAVSNCVVNPLLYYYSTKSFRDDAQKVGFSCRFSRFSRLGFVRDQAAKEDNNSLSMN